MNSSAWYVIRRVLTMIPTLFFISVVVFAIIQLPPGDYLESYIAELEAAGETVDMARVEFLRTEYGLDQPIYVQYWRWISGLMVGDPGWSFEHDRPVSEVVGDRLYLTILLSVLTVLFTWLVAFPIGIYSALKPYSWGDYGLTFIGFIGLATPNFLLALVVLYFANVWFGISIGGLMDPEYLDQPWSLAPTCSTSSSAPMWSRPGPKACRNRKSSAATRCALRSISSWQTSATCCRRWSRVRRSWHWCCRCRRPDRF